MLNMLLLVGGHTLRFKQLAVNILNHNALLKKMLFKSIYLKDYYKIKFKIVIYRKKKAFLVLTPKHGNLGDHAIALAEIQLLNSNNISFQEITGKELTSLSRLGKLSIMDGQLIIINGGGNLGTLWIDVEQLIRNIIISNPNSKILIMPSTVYYDNYEKMHNSAKIYNSNPELTVFAREKISYDAMRGVYNHVELVPDLVFSLHCSSNIIESREGCLICFRKDSEKTISDTNTNTINKILEKIFGDKIQVTDTVLNRSISSSERKEAVYKKLKEFQDARLVVTDRLHAMIFAAITSTPCIVINSKSPKVRGCYEWVKEQDFIFFIENSNKMENDFRNALKSCLKLKECRYNASILNNRYEKLIELLREYDN